MNFFFNQFIYFFNKYKLFKKLYFFNKNVNNFFLFPQVGYFFKNCFKKKKFKELFFFLLQKYNSNFIKQIIYFFNNNLLNKKFKKLIICLKKIIIQLYFFNCFQEIKKKLILIAQYFNLKFKMVLIKETFYLSIYSTISSLKNNFLLLNFFINTKYELIFLTNFKYESNYLLKKKNGGYKNLFFILEVVKIKNYFYSRPLKWLTFYSELQIYFFFEFFFLKILEYNRELKQNEKIIIKKLLKQSFLLTIAKKKQRNISFCSHYFKRILNLIKKKKKVILFEKC
jgi:hypothetical protein